MFSSKPRKSLAGPVNRLFDQFLLGQPCVKKLSDLPMPRRIPVVVVIALENRVQIEIAFLKRLVEVKQPQTRVPTEGIVEYRLSLGE